MTRTVKQWYFGEEGKKQIKSFSKQISTIFKVKGYNPQCDDFECFFSLEEFNFIPCIREALDNTDSEEDLQEITDCLDSVYDSSVSVSLQNMMNNAAKYEQPVKERLKEMLFEKDKSFDDYVDIIFTCSIHRLRFVNEQRKKIIQNITIDL